MKTIIAGSRDINSYIDLLHAINNAKHYKNIIPTTIISGHASGVDQLGERYARENNLPLIIMPAEWGKYGRRAGWIRNNEMADKAEAVILLWDGKSRGTKMMMEIAEERNLPHYLHMII